MSEMIPQHPNRDEIRIENVLSALGNPIRLRILAVLSDDQEHACGAVLDLNIAKSTLTHHWRILRDSGVIFQRPSGRENLLSLRRDDLNIRFPGLLDILIEIALSQKDQPLSKAIGVHKNS